MRLRWLARSASGLFWEYQADKRDCALCLLWDKCLQESDKRGARKVSVSYFAAERQRNLERRCEPKLPGGAEAAAGLVRWLISRAEARAQLSARFATRLRGSGGPLPLVSDRIEPEKDDKIRRMTPVGVFFICPNEDKCYFVNSAELCCF